MSFWTENVPCFIHEFDRKFSVTMAYKPSNISGSVQPFSTKQTPLYTELNIELGGYLNEILLLDLKNGPESLILVPLSRILKNHIVNKATSPS